MEDPSRKRKRATKSEAPKKNAKQIHDDEDLGEVLDSSDIIAQITNKKHELDQPHNQSLISYDVESIIPTTETRSPSALSSEPVQKTTNTKKKKQTVVVSSLQAQREALPVYQAKKQLMDVVAANKTLIVISETGSGKTTQIPQFLHESGLTKRGIIAITQPRRVAAISISKRVAEETNTTLGGLVGYSIRFEEVCSPQTKIKYMTDGMLLRELLSDTLFKKYSAIVLDEAHERTLRTDVLFGMVKSIREVRKDLRIIVMSATLDAQKMADYFEDAVVVNIPGRQYPVEIFHTDEKQEDYLDAAVSTTLQTHAKYPPNGDILVFLTGQEEIESVTNILNEASRELPPTALKLLVAPIFANLPTWQQSQVFEPTPEGHRKVVLSTNICETSITLSGVKYVIDTGMAKSRGFNPKTGFEVLRVEPISRASAKQRSGRAGRDSPGMCFRLYTKSDYSLLPETTPPEILRKNLSSVILLLMASGVSNLLEFKFLDAPPREALERGLETLYALGAIGDDGKLTELGKSMAEFPVDPPYARVLLKSKAMNCVPEIISIVSMLSVDSVFFTPHDKREEATAARKKFTSFDGDHISLLNVLRAYDDVKKNKQWCLDNFVNSRAMHQVTDIRTQLAQFCHRARLLPSKEITLPQTINSENILKCFLSGFFMNAAVAHPDGSFKTLVGGRGVHVHPSSVVFGKKVGGVFYNELVHTSRQYMRNVSVVNPAWFAEAAPHYYGRS
ncbi:hypothetical protein SmJEL517_g04900 [Synchytrium microbalum]|uniref:RNA helicase n=1 Tax=Synchytrium microbalum TaxID=1806994 RepID=A0A507BPF3_9FUNG|nr:uncharacterized protein SmJEL517_g04900 [Synchytrium microbalum]TPX31860.1 hypothetical protein SmJEL517_g04900 [Synchytrium microbalum]